ncbi:MAG TPA: Calx-beta domain-containing protein, partial [Pirellulales bacterium]|nr:Calx-beta domain-containing protein [Pirellulales bacterium]
GVVTIQEDTEPTFTVSASPSYIPEAGGNVVFTITRSGEMNGDVTVNFGWGGSAVEGTDYTAPAGLQVTFPSGQTTETETATLIDDAGFGEPGEDLSLFLESGGGYVVGTPYSADVTITEDDDSGSSLMLNLPPRESANPPPAITPAEVRPFLDAAAREWQAAGVDPALLHRLLSGATVRVADLPGSLLGQTKGEEIDLDQNAAGYGWFLGDKRKDNGDFAIADGPTERSASPGSRAYGRVDLLTAVTHELGHLLGLGDLPPGASPQDIMALTIGLSTRRYPADGEGPQSDRARPDANDRSTDSAFGDFAMTEEPGAPGPVPAAEAPRWRDGGVLDQPMPVLAGAAGAKPRFAAEAEW